MPYQKVRDTMKYTDVVAAAFLSVGLTICGSNAHQITCVLMIDRGVAQSVARHVRDTEVYIRVSKISPHKSFVGA